MGEVINLDNKVAIRSSEFWTKRDGLIFLENNGLCIILNRIQSLVWENIDGVTPVNVLKNILISEHSNCITEEYFFDFINNCINTGIVNYVEEQWDV